jgi:hypothetical protein
VPSCSTDSSTFLASFARSAGLGANMITNNKLQMGMWLGKWSVVGWCGNGISHQADGLLDLFTLHRYYSYDLKMPDRVVVERKYVKERRRAIL